jgi:protein-L-isoaspartate(D-aspartate) O-methyltransferase
MVDQQIRTWEVTDSKVLAVFGELSRDAFVPPRYRQLAFADCEIPLGRGQKMMTPSVEGRLLQALELEPQDTVLEIGTGSAFLTACLARLSSHVTSIDLYADFITAARGRLRDHGIDNVSMSEMDASVELPAGPFDAIAVTGSLPSLDLRYVEALKAGGRLFVVTGSAPAMDAQLLVRGPGKAWRSASVFETCLIRLQNVSEQSRFVF